MKKKIVIVLLLVLGFFAIDIFVLDTVLDRELDTSQLEDTIKTSMHCEDINFDISGKGMSLKSNVYGDYHMVILTNCELTSLEQTVDLLHAQLQKSVDNFCELDLLQLTFKNATKEIAVVEIRNCELTLTYN
jgi:hypothetical protein